MIEIIPAVMPESLDHLSLSASRVRGLVPLVQIDVVDGQFAPKRTWPYTPRGQEEFFRIAHEEEGLPLWQDLDYEIDLMVKNPEEAIGEWIAAGARRLIFHIESTRSPGELLSRFEAESGKGSEYEVECGLALNIETPLEDVGPYLSRIGFVQLMGIARIGFQGEPFDERVLTRLSKLRERYPDLILSVDGGVHLENAPSLIAAGASRLVAGSEIFGSADIKETLERFASLENNT